MKNLTLIISLISFISCNSKDQKTQVDTSWAKIDENKWPQILLTNSIQFNGREQALGASGFLLCGSEDTFACTAKHLLGEAMGITPEIPIDSFNQLLKYWQMHPRNDKTNDTINIERLVNLDINEIDILLFRVKNVNKNVEVLKPHFETLKNGEQVKIIGCEYKDSNCNQKIFNAEVVGNDGSKIIIQSKNLFDPSGFSGAPVINHDGNVIGLVSGGGNVEDKLYLYIESISGVSNYLE